MKRIVLAGLVLVLTLMFVAGCSPGGPGQDSKPNPPSTTEGAPSPGPSEDIVEIDDVGTDQMFNEMVYGDKLYVFIYEDTPLTVENCYPVDVYADEPLKDGGFYKVTADVEYLNGGIAGYVNFPDIKEVHSCEEVSPNELNLPSLKDTIYGLVLIGDYADGDILLNEMGVNGVWRDGKWIWHYSDEVKLDDGRGALVREGVTKETVQAGVDNGVLSCEDYFVLPLQE